MGFPLFFIFVGVIIAVAILAAIAAHKRRKALAKLAARKGLRFNPHDAFNLPNVYGQTKLCSVGHSRKAKNVIYGDIADGEIRYFDYRYTTGSGKNSQTHSFGACAFHTGCHFAPMIVRREGLFDKVAGFFGFDDVDLDHGEFNRRFYVGCSDKKFAYDILSQRAMQFFLQRPWLSMETSWNYCIFYRSGTPGIPEVARLIEDAAAFFDLIPHYLKQERAMRPSPAGGATPDTGASAQSRYRFDGIEPRGKRAGK